jgi:hypothetical protein
MVNGSGYLLKRYLLIEGSPRVVLTSTTKKVVVTRWALSWWKTMMSDREEVLTQAMKAGNEAYLRGDSMVAEIVDRVVLPLLAEARREGAVQALRDAAVEASDIWVMRPLVDKWLNARADKIAKGETDD